MSDKPDLKRAYLDEKRGAESMSDSELAQRCVDLKALIENTEREYVESLAEAVRRGMMAAEDAARKHEDFQRQLRDLKIPFGPS